MRAVLRVKNTNMYEMMNWFIKNELEYQFILNIIIKQANTRIIVQLLINKRV